MTKNNVFYKKAYVSQMSYDVSDVEKIKAEKALLCFSHAEKALDKASDHLNIMKTPFKDHPEMQPKDIMKARVSIRKFRDKSAENFNNFKSIAFQCVNIMQTFASDTQTVKLMKSFISSIDDLEAKVNKFIDLFNDLQSKDFVSNIVSNIEDVQNQCEEIVSIIDDRIKNHIQSNILASSWVDAVSNNLQIKIEKQTPLILDLHNKMQEQLNENLKNQYK